MRTPVAPVGWPKVLRPPSVLTGSSPVSSKVPLATMVLRLALLAEAEVLVGQQLGQREAVVQLHHVELAERLADAGLAVGILGGVERRLPGQEVEVGVALRVRRAGDADRLHQHVIGAPLLRQIRARDDRRGRAVGLRRGSRRGRRARR